MRTDQNRTSIQIGVHMPSWIPARWHFAARVMLGTVIGVLILCYAAAMAYSVDRILWAMHHGGHSDEVAFDLAYMATMTAAAFVLRHVLKRGRARPVAEM